MHHLTLLLNSPKHWLHIPPFAKFTLQNIFLLFVTQAVSTFETSSYTQIFTDMFPFYKYSLLLYLTEIITEICQNAAWKKYFLLKFSQKKYEIMHCLNKIFLSNDMISLYQSI